MIGRVRRGRGAMSQGLSELGRTRRRPAPSHIAAMVVGLALMVGFAYLLMPWVLRDRAALTQAPDTAGASTGAAAALTERLRAEGLSCTDRPGPDLLRLCAAPHDRGGSDARFSADADGRLRILIAGIDASRRPGTIDVVIEAAATAFGLTDAARTRFLADAAATGTAGRTDDWGSYRIEREHRRLLLTMSAAGSGVEPEVTLALPGTLDRVRAIAVQRGYVCSNTSVGSLACNREVAGYSDRLYVEPWPGGRLFRIDFEVVADRRVGVLAEWNTEFAAILAELGGTAAPVSEWLQANPRAGGADVFIGPVELSYRVDLDAYVKEVFGGVRTARL